MSKILTLNSLDSKLKEIKRDKIILAGGSFDILHAGHIEFLEKSKDLGGKLIVLLESDESIKKSKGEDRPLHSQQDRAKILSHLDLIDFVVLLPLFEDKDYNQLVKKIKPDIIAIVKTDSSKNKKFNQAKSVGAKLIEVMEKNKKHSTTGIINKLNK